MLFPTALNWTSIGPSAQYLYVNEGNPGVIHALYYHFAKQVLGDVLEKDIVTRTTRSLDFPIHILRIDGHPRKLDDYLHDVTALLRQLLSEVPSGILGSKYLFRVLRQILKHQFTSDRVDKDPGRREYVRETSSIDAAKVRMITLALIALTTELQLELICAVFSLLTMTDDESACRQYYHTQSIHPGRPDCTFCMAYPRKDIIASAYCQLLTGYEGPNILHKPVRMRQGLAVEVMMMMITHWKSIVLQMQQWEVIAMRDAAPPPKQAPIAPLKNPLPEIISRCFSCNQELPSRVSHHCPKRDFLARSSHSSHDS